VLIAYAEDVASFQGFAEGLIALNNTPLVQQPVGGALLLWMRVYKYEPVAFTHYLSMKS